MKKRLSKEKKKRLDRANEAIRKERRKAIFFQQIEDELGCEREIILSKKDQSIKKSIPIYKEKCSFAEDEEYQNCFDFSPMNPDSTIKFIDDDISLFKDAKLKDNLFRKMNNIKEYSTHMELIGFAIKEAYLLGKEVMKGKIICYNKNTLDGLIMEDARPEGGLKKKGCVKISTKIIQELKPFVTNEIMSKKDSKGIWNHKEIIERVKEKLSIEYNISSGDRTLKTLFPKSDYK